MKSLVEIVKETESELKKQHGIESDLNNKIRKIVKQELKKRGL